MPLVTEDTWTGPCDPGSTWCTHPEDWHAWDDEATEVEVTELVASLVRATQPEVCLETGAYTGQTTEAIGKALAQNGHGHLYATEIDERRHAVAEFRCQDLPVTVNCGRLDETELPDAPIDFAFIDAGENRIEEIAPYLGRFSPAAIIVVHDVAPHHVVWGFMEPLIAEGRLTALRLRTPRGVAICQVP